MKKLFLLFITYLLVSESSFAGHTAGGELGWECLGNGQYVFTMRIYRDCQSIPFTYTNETVSVHGSPLPRTINNTLINSITMRPDSARFLSARNGSNAPQCAGPSLSCSGGPGVIQQFFYQSDPITITNTAPTAGWTFYKNLPCCSSSLNFNITGGFANAIVARMYTPNGINSLNPCIDNSPQLSELPLTLTCSGIKGNIFFDPVDQDLDSFAISSVAPFSAATPPNPRLAYGPGFSPSNPTPDASRNVFNVPLTIEPNTGLASLLVNVNSAERYLMNFRVRTYRDGQLIAENYRESFVIIYPCVPLANNTINQAPLIRPPFYKGGSTFTFEDSVVAGNNINFDLNVWDTDRKSSNAFQNIRVLIASTALSRDLTNSSNCLGNIQNCATVNSTPIFDTLEKRFVYNRTGVFNGRIDWNTDCSHLRDSTYAKDYYFTLIATDDHCPVPATAAATYKITVLPSAACSGTVGLSEENKPKFLIYPNPTTGEIQIKSTDAIQQLRLFSLDGKIVQQLETINSNRLRFTINQKPGIYFIELQSTSGNIERMKVIKK